MISRASGRFGLHPFKTECGEIELLHEDIDHPDGVVFCDVVVESFRKQDRLGTILTLDVSLHD